MSACLKEVTSQQQQRLQSIEEKLKNLESGLINTVSESEENGSLMDASTHQSQPCLGNRLGSASEVLSSFINEEKERSRRRLNVIVHNIPES